MRLISVGKLPNNDSHAILAGFLPRENTFFGKNDTLARALLRDLVASILRPPFADPM